MKRILVLARCGSTLGDRLTDDGVGVGDGAGLVDEAGFIDGAGFVDGAAVAGVVCTLPARCALEGGSSCRIAGNWSSESKDIFLIHLSRHECQLWCGYWKASINCKKSWQAVLGRLTSPSSVL